MLMGVSHTIQVSIKQETEGQAGLHSMRHTWPRYFDKLLETVEMNTNDFVASDQNLGIERRTQW